MQDSEIKEDASRAALHSRGLKSEGLLARVVIFQHGQSVAGLDTVMHF